MLIETYILRALLAAALLAPLCGLLGVFVTARRMSFFSDTISHSALAGVAIGFWFGMSEPTVPMVLVAVAVAAAILWLKENTELMTDTIMALLLSGSVAAGIIVLSLLRANRGDIHRFLFGDILAVSSFELCLAAVLLIGAGWWTFARLSNLALLTTHEELAHVSGVPVRALNYAFVLELTFAVALSIRLLGIVLVTSLLVIPPAAARNLSRNLRQQIVASLVLGLAGSVLGIVCSYLADTPCGPSIVLVCVIAFVCTLLIGRMRRPR